MVVQKGAAAATVPKTLPASLQSSNYEQISQDPLKHVITFIEKKIRNLDKRKAKLDSYKKMVDDGKRLDPDQTAAASKYDEVIGSLDFAKDLVKTFEATTTEVLKLQKKTLRNEQIAREESDNGRVCFVLRAMRIMELLHDNDLMKEHFLSGSNEACVVSKLELDQLVSFYECFIMQSYEAGTNVLEDGNTAGNHMYQLAEARSIEVVGTTYKELRVVLDRINDCKYFEDLPDVIKINEVHQTQKDEIASVSSESSAEEMEPNKLEEKDGELNEENDAEKWAKKKRLAAEIENSDVPSAHMQENLSSSVFSTDAALKSDEMLQQAEPAYTDNDNTWQQQQQIEPKPEAGDYNIMQRMNFQYVANEMIQPQTNITQTAYQHQVQTIQDMLADVQGPCQFLQDSVIDFEMPSSTTAISFTGMDMHQQPTAVSLKSQIDPRHAGQNHLQQIPNEAAYTNQQKASPIDQASLQHLGTTRDSPSHLPNTVTHAEHISANIEHLREPIHMSPKPSDPEPNATNNVANYNGEPFMGQLPSTSPSRVSPNTNMDYLGHAQPSPAQQDNLGLGQTTFGGGQQQAGTHAYQTDDPLQQANLMQQHKLSSPDPPTTHIPLPNEQQSGYRSYQPGETETDTALTADGEVVDQLGPGKGIRQTHAMSSQEQRSELKTEEELQDSNVSSTGGIQTGQSIPNDPNSQQDQNSRYGSRGASDGRSQQMGGSTSRHMRGGYSNNGYRTGPINPGGGGSSGGTGNYRNPNYRPNNRYNGNYDSMGRPNNYSGGYQGNQSSYGMYRPQDPYMYNRRGTGGNVRGGRGGHQQRGNPRGGGNYNRSRTFRPQHSSEQAA